MIFIPDSVLNHFIFLQRIEFPSLKLYILKGAFFVVMNSNIQGLFINLSFLYLLFIHQTSNRIAIFFIRKIAVDNCI